MSKEQQPQHPIIASQMMSYDLPSQVRSMPLLMRQLRNYRMKLQHHY